MFCRKCGSKIPSDSLFCTNCGMRVEGVSDKRSDDNLEKKADDRVHNVKGHDENSYDEVVNRNKTGVKKVLKKGVDTSLNVGAEVSRGVVTAGVKTGSSFVNKAIKWSAIVAIVAGGLALASSLYVEKVSSSPVKIVEKMMNSIDDEDYKTLFSCFDPDTQEKLAVTSSLASSLISGVSGMSIDFDSLLDVQSAFSDLTADPNNNCNATNFKTVKYVSNNHQDIVDKYGSKFEAVSIYLSNSAFVDFEVDNKEGCYLTDDNINGNGSKLVYEMRVQKYGNKWLIPIDTTVTFITSK